MESNRCPRCGGSIVGFNGVATCFMCGFEPANPPHAPTAEERKRVRAPQGGNHSFQTGGTWYPQAGGMRGMKG